MRTLRRVPRGFVMIELLVAAGIFVIVALGAGSLYLAMRRSFELSTAETFLQRQGTAIQEDLADHIRRANSILVGPSGLCGPTGVTVAENQAVRYTRLVQSGGSGPLAVQTWCVYRHPSSTPYPKLFRCQITSGTTCASGLGRDLLQGAVLRPDQALSVTVASFDFFSSGSSVNITFDLDLRRIATNQSLLFSPRRFSVNTTIRN